MMLRMAWRSLFTRPLRAAVLAGGFGFGIAVMAALLGVGQVILEQAHAPALQGGGDLTIGGVFGSVESARYVMTTVLESGELAHRVAAVSPSRKARLFLMTPHGALAITARGGVPSLEKSVGDPEVSAASGWVDAPRDTRWSRPDPGDVLRSLDRFHAIADAPAWASSWAEWLYFNGRSSDGRLRVYVTFLVGPRSRAGTRTAGVRLQLERDGKSTSYSDRAEIDEAALLQSAPDLDIAGNHVRLEGLTYRIALALPGVTGEIVLDAAPNRSIPPAEIRGAAGWLSGYAVPVLAGTLRGTLRIGGESLTFDRASGYHDHNWGFWQGVRWQWGQVAYDDVSIVYGRVFPPGEVADARRVRGFLAVLGPGGPLGFSTDVTIDDQPAAGRVDVHARGSALDLRLTFLAGETVRSAMPLTQSPAGLPMDFLQLGGTYSVLGHVGARAIEFTARGAAETFRPR
jgi:hypothetical protein